MSSDATAPPRGESPDSDRSPTAVRILDEAERLFAEQGFRGTSLSQVTDRVGIRGPSLFNHFKNKQELYEAVLERLLAPFFAMLADLATGPPSAERQDEAVARMLAHHARNPHLAFIIQHAVLAGGEQFELLVERWYRPFFDSIPSIESGETGETSETGTTAEAAGTPPGSDTAAVIMAFNAMILGYVTLSPLHARLLDVNPLAPDQVSAYERVLAAMRRGDTGAGG